MTKGDGGQMHDGNVGAAVVMMGGMRHPATVAVRDGRPASRPQTVRRGPSGHPGGLSLVVDVDLGALILAAVEANEAPIDGHFVCQNSVIERWTGLEPHVVADVLASLLEDELIEAIPVVTEDRTILVSIRRVLPDRERSWAEDATDAAPAGPPSQGRFASGLAPIIPIARMT